jgi:Protein of unknown function (DUF2442)
MRSVLEVKPFTEVSPSALWVKMDDGREGVFDVAPYLRTDYFNELKSPAYFSQVRLFFRGIGWPNGQDFGPDTIHAELQETITS